jgi:malate dehydrogenase (quinone)
LGEAGEVRIEAIPGLTFNVTPSPGGTCCLGNGARDLEEIVARLGCRFDRERLARELYGESEAAADLTERSAEVPPAPP